MANIFFPQSVENWKKKTGARISEPEVFEDTNPDYKIIPSSGHIPPLRILVLVVGSQGDIEPFISFSKALREQGHRIRFATHLHFKTLVEKEELEFFPLDGDPHELMSFMVKHPNLITLNHDEISKKQQLLKRIYDSAWEACIHDSITESPNRFHPEVIIANPPVQVHIHIAEKLQIPLFLSFTMPWTCTNSFPHPLAPSTLPISERATYQWVNEMMWVGSGSIQNEFRRKKLQLPKIEMGETLVEKLRIPFIYSMSPSIIPKPEDWGPHIDVVGNWFEDKTESFQPPRDLQEFLEEGEPPIYIGFGSIVLDDWKDIFHDLVTVISTCERRAVIYSGWTKLGEGVNLPENIKMIGHIPHDWLFPRCSMIIHHGGAGTTATAIRSKVPSIVIYFFGDQSFWGHRIAELGVGSDPISHNNLTKLKLAQAIHFCSQDVVLQKAQELGEKIIEEKGIENGLEAFREKLPIHDGVWEEEVFENQRKDTFMGWSSNHLLSEERRRYTDKTGLQAKKLENFQLPEDWKWISDWEVVKNENTDDQGWRYAQNFSDPAKIQWKARPTSSDRVRCRKLIRKRTYEPRESSEPSSAVASVASSKNLLYVKVVEARDLPMKFIGYCHPFVEMELMKGPTGDDKKKKEERSFFSPHRTEAPPIRKKTQILDKTTNPKWNETFWFHVSENDVLKIQVLDKTTFGKQVLGHCRVDVGDVLKGHWNDKWLSLETKKGEGEIHLQFFT